MGPPRRPAIGALAAPRGSGTSVPAGIELDPQDAWPWIDLGKLLSDHSGRYEEAEQAYRRAIELDPQKAWPWSWLGKLLSDHFQRYEEAEQAYRRAIELDPQEAWPWIEAWPAAIGSFAALRGGGASVPAGDRTGPARCVAVDLAWQTAIGSFPALRGGGASVPAGHRTGPARGVAVDLDSATYCRINLQRYEEAEQAYRRAIELDPQEAWPWSRSRRTCYRIISSATRRRSKRTGGQLNWTRRMRWPWENLGELLQYRLRRHAEGAAAFLQALELDKSLADSRLGLLEACRALLADTATQRASRRAGTARVRATPRRCRAQSNSGARSGSDRTVARGPRAPRRYSAGRGMGTLVHLPVRGDRRGRLC